MAKLTAAWRIGEVEIPSRIVLAPMAGVSVQAFRRQGRRYGAGLVCSEMVSSCGLSYGNERTLGYLRIARDEHPLAVQIFGSEPERMAEAAGMVVDAGADIVDINMGCPVRKVTKTGAGASALEDHELACRIAGAVVEAVDVPVTVKMRRGLKNGSRAALDLGTAARGSGRRRADAPSPLSPADVHGVRRPHADRRAGRAWSPCPSSPPATSSTGRRPSGCSPTPAPPP